MNKKVATLSLCLSSLLSASPVFATTTNMPWEGPLTLIYNSIQGPVVRVVALIVICACGLTLAFGEGGGGFRKLIGIVFGISIAVSATNLYGMLFGGTAGVAF